MSASSLVGLSGIRVRDPPDSTVDEASKVAAALNGYDAATPAPWGGVVDGHASFDAVGGGGHGGLAVIAG